MDGYRFRATLLADALDWGSLARPRAFRGPGKRVPRSSRQGGCTSAGEGRGAAVRAVLVLWFSMLLGGSDAQGFGLGQGSTCVSHESCLAGLFCKATPEACYNFGFPYACGVCAPCQECGCHEDAVNHVCPTDRCPTAPTQTMTSPLQASSLPI